MSWQLQEAKNKLSQLVKEARESGPQIITVHGKEAAVVISAEEYRRLSGNRETLADLLLDSPLVGSDLDIVRDQNFGRNVDL